MFRNIWHHYLKNDIQPDVKANGESISKSHCLFWRVAKTATNLSSHIWPVQIVDTTKVKMCLRWKLTPMKTKSDPRQLVRERVLKELFATSFHIQPTHHPRTREVINSLTVIDDFIVRSAPEWPVEKIGKIDLAVLRLSIFELAIERKEPPKVIIDEAVELAKEFGGDSSPKFINGVLGTVYSWINKTS